MESMVEEERRRGLDTKLEYMKTKVRADWYEWNEKEDRIVDLKCM